MCGICYVKRLDGKRAKKSVVKRYERQKSRGKEGFGYVAIDDGYVTEYIKTAKENDIMEKIRNQSANELLFHHRYPTSTPNFAMCAHPIKVSHASLTYDYYVVHNGIIYDDEELKAKHNKLGFTYTTEVRDVWRDAMGNDIEVESVKWNDSETLAIELALDIEGGFKGLAHVRGSIAFICLQADKETGQAIKMFYGRNFMNPLKIEIVENKYISITSEGRGDDVEAHRLCYIDYINMKHEFIPYQIGYNYQATQQSQKLLPVGFSDTSMDRDRHGYERDDYEDTIGHLFRPKHRDIVPPPETKIEADEEGEIKIPSIESEEYYKLLDERDALEEIVEGYQIEDSELTQWKSRLTEVEMLLERIELEADLDEIKQAS